MNRPDNESEFEITIEFEPGSGEPARIFKTMSGLIEALGTLDSHLASSFDIALDATVVLDEIKSGSLKSIFRNVIKGVPDEALKDGEWKKILGLFLIRSKYKILEWLEDRENIATREEVKKLEDELRTIAEETDLKKLPAYGAPNAETLLNDINTLQESLSNLEKNDSAAFSYGGNIVPFNKELNISNEVIREVLTKDLKTYLSEQVVKVKKPDYLGQSQWVLQYDGRSIEAKINDHEWLKKFQTREIDVRPGDSLRVIIYEEISHGYEGEVVHRHYEINEVLHTIPPSHQTRIDY